MRRLRVVAPAKINLFLRVLGVRADGYHDLETLFQAIDLEDELIVQKTSGATSLEVPGFSHLETEDNLVLRALSWVEREIGQRLSVQFRLNKRIPDAAGLGGGSSDAAAALVGLREVYDLPLTDDDLRRGALALGADVPFFLKGGTAVGEGIGERLTSVELPVDYTLVLVNPGFPVSTARIFRERSKFLTGTCREGTLWQLLRETGRLDRLLHNDLQEVAERLHPEISRVRQYLESVGIARTLMTGSGPTVFGIGEPGSFDSIRNRLPAQWNLLVTRPLLRGVMVD